MTYTTGATGRSGALHRQPGNRQKDRLPIGPRVNAEKLRAYTGVKRALPSRHEEGLPASKRVSIAPTPERITYPAPVASQQDVLKLVESLGRQAGKIAKLGSKEKRTEALSRLWSDLTGHVLAAAGRRGAPDWSSVSSRKVAVLALVRNADIFLQAVDDGRATDFSSQLKEFASDVADPSTLKGYLCVEDLKISVVSILVNCMLLHGQDRRRASELAYVVLESLGEAPEPSTGLSDALEAMMEEWEKLKNVGSLCEDAESLITAVATQIHQSGPEPVLQR
ncbi:hypothetical protein [Rhizobacter sp. OV335]|uniref:hypothetical protein n=1 Tax=Rhizobacter sp. OV335 TaxID=1500264 RepID=UPI000937B822|nr:hypothetical protein [Rhizobacter sp. OV335]